jgi:hypothetical protein
MNALKLFFGRLWFRLFVGFGFYGLWSRLYQWVWLRRYKNITLSTYKTYQDLVNVTKTLKWVADGPKQLWDAFSSPQWVEYVVKWSADKRVGDCDEFAIYNANTLNRSVTDKAFTDDPNFSHAGILTVSWIDKDGHISGHNVALLISEHEFDQMYQYMDYDLPSTKQYSVRQVVQDILDRYAPGGELIAYSVMSPDLKHVAICEAFNIPSLPAVGSYGP